MQTTVANAIHGRSILQELEGSSRSSVEDDEEQTWLLSSFDQHAFVSTHRNSRAIYACLNQSLAHEHQAIHPSEFQCEVWGAVDITRPTRIYATGRFINCFSIVDSEASRVRTAPIPYSKNEADIFLQQLYLNSARMDDAALLSFTFEIIEKSFAENNLSLLDAILLGFNPSKSKRIVATGLLRATFRAKARMSSWTRCLGRVWTFLEDSGENPQKLLRGLVSPDDRITFAEQQTIL